MDIHDKYVQVYDKIGHESFAHGDDKHLRLWGNSEERIRQIKIEAVKCRLERHKEGIECYKILQRSI